MTSVNTYQLDAKLDEDLKLLENMMDSLRKRVTYLTGKIDLLRRTAPNALRTKCPKYMTKDIRN